MDGRASAGSFIITRLGIGVPPCIDFSYFALALWGLVESGSVCGSSEIARKKHNDAMGVYSTTFDNQTHLDLIRPIISNATALRALKLCQPLPSMLPPVDEKILVDLVVSSVPVRTSRPVRMNFASIPPPALRMSRLDPFQIPEPGSPPCVLRASSPAHQAKGLEGCTVIKL